MCRHSVRLVLFYFSFELILHCYSYEYPVHETTQPTDKKAQRQAGWIDPFDMSSDGIHSYDAYRSASDIDSNSIGWKDFNHAHGTKYSNRPTESTASEKFIIYQQFINVFLKAMALKVRFSNGFIPPSYDYDRLTFNGPPNTRQNNFAILNIVVM